MPHIELIVLFLLVVVTALTVAAQRLDVPYPILLVIGGCALGLVPGLPEPDLDPDVVLLIFLPPLLYDTALRTSRRELRRNVSPIATSAIGLVLLTMVVVAIAVHLAVPGLPWAAAFAFGAIVSPTDPLAAVAIARRLGVPRRLVTLVEGESLINDATALAAYTSAVAAVTGSFSLLDSGGDFVLNVVGGAVIGLVVAQVLSWVFRQIDDDQLTVTVTLLAGYAAYLPAEQLGLSGVIAAVVVGLVNGHRIAELFGHGARLSATAFWDVLVFLLNAVLFVLVGLQLPAVLYDQERSMSVLIALGALAGSVVILARLLWLHTTPWIIQALDRRPQHLQHRIAWRERTVIGWAGLRGAVSLAAALALPIGFPERDLLIWMTICVIVATLVLQGLTLPLVIRRLGVEQDDAAELEDLHARKAATGAALLRIDQLREQSWVLPDSAYRLRRAYEFRDRRLRQRACSHEEEEDLEARSSAWQHMVREVLDAQRRRLVELRNEGDISDHTLYTVMRELDLEDERLEM